MKYIYEKKQPSRYTATNLDNSRGYFSWDGARGMSVLLVKTPYGVNLQDKLEEICGELNEHFSSGLDSDPFGEGLLDEPVEAVLGPGYSVVYLTAHQRYAPEHKGCRYTVVLCEKKENGDMIIYPPAPGGMSVPYIDFLWELRFTVEKSSSAGRKRILFRKSRDESEFYEIGFPPELVELAETEYIEYDESITPVPLEIKIRIDVNRWINIPVTLEMYRNKKVYIKTDQKPELVLSDGASGIRLIQ